MQYLDMRRIVYMIASPYYKYIFKTRMVTDFVPDFALDLIFKELNVHGVNSVTTVVYPFKWNTVFGNNFKSKMGILNVIRKIYFNQKTLTKIFFEVCIRFHKCWDRMES